MTTLKKAIITATIIAAVALGVYQARQISNLRGQLQALREAQQQQTALSDEVRELRHERDLATNALAALSAERVAQKKSPNEVLKLRGEVGRLQQEKNELGSSSALSKVTADPETTKLLRSQQKMGMGMIYKGFARQAKLTPEQSDKLNDLLADSVMENVTNITTVLRDKPAAEQVNQLFATQDAALQAKVQDLLGPEAAAQYQDYTRNLASTLTAEQFKGEMTGDDAAKETKAKQLSQLMQQQVQAALAGAGLPADYQVVPILNFRNIASEAEGERSLKLLDDIYQQVSAGAAAFLSPTELEKFQEFRNTALKNNRAALTLNRNMMAPIGN